MNKFYTNLDDHGQITPSVTERNILLAAGLLMSFAALFILIVAFSQTDIYLLLGVVVGLCCLGISLGCILFYKGRNVYGLPLGTFFQIDETQISYRFSVFGRTRTYRWEAIQKAEISMYVAHLWVDNSLHEIDLEEIADRHQRVVVKHKVREVLSARGLIRVAA